MFTKQIVNPVLSGEVKEFFRQTGSIGGKTRAARYSKAQLRKWGKLGGRPRKNPATKGASDGGL